MNLFLRIKLTESTMQKVNSIVETVNEGFQEGRVYAGDIINLAINELKPDVSKIRNQNINVRRVIVNLAKKKGSISLDDLIAEAKRLEAVTNSNAKSKSKERTDG